MNREITQLITVVIPVYNREKLVVRTLDSISDQIVLPSQIIIVDNNSSDDTIVAVKEWGALHPEISLRIAIETTPGAAAARQHGLNLVTTPYTLFFDSDDRMLPNHIQCVADAIRNNPEVDVITWRCQSIMPSGRRKTHHFTTGNPWNCHLYHSLLRTLGYCASTSFFRKVGGWNTSLLHWDDFELGVRILLASPRIVAIKKVLVEIYPQEDSITGTNYHSNAGGWEKSLDECERQIAASSHLKKEALIRLIIYRRAILAADYNHEGKKDLSNTLLKKALNHNLITPPLRLILRLLHRYRSLGGRGGAIIWNLIN